jgi:hypothetical protein
MSGGSLRALEAAEAGLVQREGGRPRGLPAKEREFFIAPAPVWRACVWYHCDNAQPQGTAAHAHRGDPMSAAPSPISYDPQAAASRSGQHGIRSVAGYG